MTSVDLLRLAAQRVRDTAHLEDPAAPDPHDWYAPPEHTPGEVVPFTTPGAEATVWRPTMARALAYRLDAAAAHHEDDRRACGYCFHDGVRNPSRRPCPDLELARAVLDELADRPTAPPSTTG